MASQGGVGGQNILLILAPMCFLWNNLWSVCRYIMGPFSGWRSLYGKGKPPHLKKYVRNRWSPIHISHRFTSKLHILHKSDNIVHWVFAYRRCDKPDDVQFMKSWEKVCRIVWCRLKLKKFRCVFKYSYIVPGFTTTIIPREFCVDTLPVIYIMNWPLTSTKTSSKPMMTWFTQSYKGHKSQWVKPLLTEMLTYKYTSSTVNQTHATRT